MRGAAGTAVFVIGMIGVLAGSKGRRGRENGDRQQKIVCTIGFLLVLAGLLIAQR